MHVASYTGLYRNATACLPGLQYSLGYKCPWTAPKQRDAWFLGLTVPADARMSTQ
jgi:hypothetical protein